MLFRKGYNVGDELGHLLTMHPAHSDGSRNDCILVTFWKVCAAQDDVAEYEDWIGTVLPGLRLPAFQHALEYP